MFNTVNHSVEAQQSNPIESVASILVSEKKGKLVSFPIIWASGDMGNVAVYTGSIYKITDVQSESRKGCKVYFIDSTDEQRKYENGSLNTTLSMDEVIKLLNE